MGTRSPILGPVVVLLATVFLWAASAGGASAAIYIKFDGVDGESTDAGRGGWCDVSSFASGVSRVAIVGVPGPLAAEIADLRVVKPVDKASPILYRACCAGQHIAKATLVARYDSGGRLLEKRYDLTDVVVSSVSPAATGALEVPTTESLTLNYGRVVWVYRVLDPATGDPLEVIATGWDAPRDAPYRSTRREVLDHLLGVAALPAEYLGFADANGDGRLDVSEVIRLSGEGL